MQYLTACYGQQGEEDPSLLLSQFQCRETPVCLAYLACGRAQGKDDPGEEPLGGLRLWCRQFPWTRAVRRPERWLERAEGELVDRVGRPAGGAFCHTLLLAIGGNLLLLGGGQPVYLVNTAYGRGCAELLQPGFRGSLEAGAGILLATPAFAENLQLDLLGKSLCPAQLREEAQAERRLRELAEQGGGGGAACRAGGRPLPAGRAAILLVMRHVPFGSGKGSFCNGFPW